MQNWIGPTVKHYHLGLHHYLHLLLPKSSMLLLLSLLFYPVVIYHCSMKWDTSLPKLGTMNSPRKAHEPRSKIFKAQRSVKISLFEAISMIFKVKQRKGHCPDGSNDLCRDMLHRRIPIPFQFSFGLSVFFFSLSLTQMDMINRRIPYSIWIYLWTGTYFFT